jgi:lipopolysaccharide transport system ATP-binding protein
MRAIVEVRNLSKSYRLGQLPPSRRTLSAELTHVLRSPLEHLRGRKLERKRIIWALRDVSFEVRPGEVVGIIGRNGAGKSTLLKILSRIVRPTAGEVDIYGRMGSLLEIGTGFHPDLTGRENVYLNGAIIGMKRKEIRRKFDEIVAFAEVEQFLDTPIKYYSSGMHVRLAFAIAAHLEPEILILDEVLAVGDAAFQQKCFLKMRDVSREGRTIFFVSHDLTSVRQMCGRVLLIESGHLRYDGQAEEVIQGYLGSLAVATGD